MNTLATVEWLAYWFVKMIGKGNIQAATELAHLGIARKITN